MVELHVERTIAAPPQAVFDWLVDPVNLTAAPLALRAGFIKGTSAPAVGARRWVVGAGMWFEEEITAYDPPRSYSYLILRSLPPFNHEGGTLTLSPEGNGTHVGWRTVYGHPVYAGGKTLEAVSFRLLRSSFSAVLAGCAKALER
jgi:Polyketide cyclase / dehydrase and lipid transport